MERYGSDATTNAGGSYRRDKPAGDHQHTGSAANEFYYYANLPQGRHGIGGLPPYAALESERLVLPGKRERHAADRVDHELQPERQRHFRFRRRTSGTDQLF